MSTSPEDENANETAMTNRPRHVAIIMDGNGRWAEARGLPRALGHQAGAEAVRRVVTAARQQALPYLTLYAFSTENWSRPQEEVEALMALFLEFLDQELPTMAENGVQLRMIGDMTGLSSPLQDRIRSTCQATESGDKLVLTLAVNYGGRDEIVRAVRKAAMAAPRQDGLDGLDPSTFGDFLDTSGMPDPDLVIRTAGEQRLSNFLVWQAAYAELYFTKTLWPDFGPDDLDKAFRDYAGRVRTFGKI